jgi:ADP-ribose pyrophosphatase
MIKPWPIVDSKKTGDYRIFTVRTERKLSPRTGKEHEFYVIDCANWVNIIAVTPDDQLVMIEQFRHGTNTVELEIPGGMIDARDASPVAAGTRELREETGYTGEQPEVIGSIYPNPAIMSNTCYTVLVKNCRLSHEMEWDQAEDIVTRLVPVADIPKLVAGGQIRHSLVVVALYHFELLRRKR